MHLARKRRPVYKITRAPVGVLVESLVVYTAACSMVGLRHVTGGLEACFGRVENFMDALAWIASKDSYLSYKHMTREEY